MPVDLAGLASHLQVADVDQLPPGAAETLELAVGLVAETIEKADSDVSPESAAARLVTLSVAARVIDNPRGRQSESLGDHTKRFFALALPLTAGELELLGALPDEPEPWSGSVRLRLPGREP